MKTTHNIQLAIQFLEPCPRVIEYDPELVKDKLKTALDLLPISIVIIGWDIPEKFVDICRDETSKRGIKLYRWQPLLTSDGELPVIEDFRVIGLNGYPIPGFRKMPSFTFMCANHQPYREQLLEHIADVLSPGKYDGIFLDRMRFPALTQDLNTSLACFCPSCHKAAEKIFLDLNKVKAAINNMISTKSRRREFLQVIMLPASQNPLSGNSSQIEKFFNFRTKAITGIVNAASKVAHSLGVEVGLDCFSPSLSCSVGQDMHALDKIGDWIKPMTYLHTFAPAGLPFEINEMHTFLGKAKKQEFTENSQFLSHTMGFPIPTDQEVLMGKGLDSIVLTREISKAKHLTSKPILEGMELVEIPGITWIDQDQLQRDMKAILESEADGIVISWDLWHIKKENLQTIADTILSHSS